MLELQAPSVLAQLPRQLSAEGKVWFSPVYGSRTSEKVKRYEIVAAIDGEALNIYNIQTPKPVVSYSIPPQSAFACAPCSIRSKLDRKSPPVRHTYCVFQGPNAQLKCFTERDELDGSSKVSSTSLSLPGTSSPVVLLETIPHNDNNRMPWDVLVVHQDGTVRMVPADLSAQRWMMKMTNPSRVSNSQFIVAAAHWISGEHARNSLLRNRPDLLIHADGQTSSSSYLIVVAKEIDGSSKELLDMEYGLWRLTDELFRGFLGPDDVNEMLPLLSHSMPKHKLWSKHDAAQYTFNSLNGSLSIAHSQGLTTYDLSALTPELTSKFSPHTGDNTETRSLMRLSPSLAVCATPSTLMLFDTKYSSVQSVLDLDMASSRRKRKKTGPDLVRFVTYFPKIQRVLACRGNTLMAFDVSNVDVQGGHNALSGASLLIDAVGHGMSSASAQRTKSPGVAALDFGTIRIPVHLMTDQWLSHQQRLDDLIKAGNLADFERTMSRELCDSLPENDISDSGDLRLPRSSLHVDQSKIDYLLSKLFQLDLPVEQDLDGANSPVQSLKLVLEAPRMIRWLISTGLLVERNIERALLASSTSKALRLRPGSLALALIQDDPSCEVIIHYLTKSPYLTISEVLQAAKLLLADVVAAAQKVQGISPMQLDNDSRDGELPGTVGLSSLDNLEPVAENLPLSVLQHAGERPSLGHASTALLIALEIFSSHSSRSIVSEIRVHLSQPEVLSMIQLLRQQLFHSGHTSYLPTPPVSATASPNLGTSQAGDASLSLDTILKLLSSCLDAFGSLGFLAQSESDDFLEKLIPDLKSEISFAFEGMQETNHLQGLLREVIRFADSAPNGHDTYPSGTTIKPALLENQKPGTIVTLYRELGPDSGDVGNSGEMLPLSLRADTVSKKKVRKGGGQVRWRSQRDILRLQSRNVGRYSFERLVL